MTRAVPSTIAVFCILWTGLALSQTDSPDVAPERWYTDELVALGGGLFSTHCATCHGSRAQGAPEWQQPDASGKSRAPPLDGSGHGWHHPASALQYVILNGTPGGSGSMPAWKDTLSRKDSAALIAWFQSLWSDEIYRTWYDIETRSRQ